MSPTSLAPERRPPVQQFVELLPGSRTEGDSPTACEGRLPEWVRVGELMATQSRRILLGTLDRMVYSSANYWVVMLSDLAAALAFLALGLNRFSGPWVVAGGVAIVGFMSLGGRLKTGN
jgi:hypothetical protein